MKQITISKTSTYYLQITDTSIQINSGVLATVTISSPVPYSINRQPILVLSPAQSIILQLNGKNWEISGSTQANTIPNLESGKFLTNNGIRMLWQTLVTGVSSVFGRTGAVVSANGDYTASQITNVPAGDISAVTAQGAINELDTEKFKNSMNTNKLLGRGTAGLGVVEEITLGIGLSLAGTTLNASTGGNETLAQTLALGNTTGGTDIVVSAGDDITITDATASRIAQIDASKNVDSLDTATYPSLAELARLKGVTSDLQPQIDSKLSLSGGTMTGTEILATGTTTVAPIKFVAGANLTTPVAGVIEFDGTDFYITI